MGAKMRKKCKRKDGSNKKDWQRGNVLWRKGSFLVAFGDFFNLEAILINCVYCPKHSETKAGNGWIPVSLWLCFFAHNPLCEYTYTPQDSNLWVHACANTHTQKGHTLRSTKKISLDKKTFRRCERELRESVSSADRHHRHTHTRTHSLSSQSRTSPLP